MKLNKFMFSEEFAYTYSEVKSEIFGSSAFVSTNLALLLVSLNLMANNSGKCGNTYDYSFLADGENIGSCVRDFAVSVLNKIELRYGEHYAVVIASEEEFSDASEKFMKKLFNVLDYTYDKYSTLLHIYAQQKSHLLDKLQRIRDEDKTNSASGQHYNTRVLDEDKSNSKSDEHYNTKGTSVSSSSSSGSQSASSDTPQTINTTGDADDLNGYWNKYDKAHDSASSSSSGSETDNGRTSGTGSESTDATETDNGSISSSGSESFDATESYDPMTMMARIEEIQTKYENTMFKWVEEFDRLFIEEGNI